MTTDVGPTTSTVGTSEAVGPSFVVDGIGHGWRRDEDGARAAAGSAVSATGAIATAGFITRDDLIGSIASSGFAGQLADESARQLDELAIELGEVGVVPSQLVWAELPLRARVLSFSQDAAAVEVWSVLVVGVPGHGAPRQVWRTVTVGLIWEREDWRVDSWQSEAGPTPALAATSTVSSVDEIRAALAWPAVGGS
ncbi:MAG TPA: hypothetical protein VFK41_05415 [Nocardioidaceae bacterium]|nr:hypothetical protein [Nocardioidaceae bacterium]